MSPIDRVYLMIRMLKENYDIELSRLERKKTGSRGRSLTTEERQECSERARKVVCEIGISMYQFERFLDSRYQKTIENEATHQAVEKGIELGLLQWGAPRRYDSVKGGEWKNIILTEKGFEHISDPGFNLAMTMMHSSYMPKQRRRLI